MADDDDQPRWRDGLAEEMIGELTRAEPSITLALEGSVRRTAECVRVTARLVHIAGGHSLWSDRFECSLDDAASAQDRIALAVAGQISDLLRGMPIA